MYYPKSSSVVRRLGILALVIALLSTLLFQTASVRAEGPGAERAGPTSPVGPDYVPIQTIFDGPIVQDGSFEDGTPNAFWDEFSTNFGTPLCTEADCGLGGGTGARTGEWWVWFGGIATTEEGSVSQEVTIPVGSATLEFYLQQPVCDSASDYMEVTIDGTQLFETTGASSLCGQLSYSLQSVDVSAYADGAAHTLEFHSEVFGTNGEVTNFFVDDVSIIVEPPTSIELGSIGTERSGSAGWLISLAGLALAAAGLVARRRR